MTYSFSLLIKTLLIQPEKIVVISLAISIFVENFTKKCDTLFRNEMYVAFYVYINTLHTLVQSKHYIPFSNLKVYIFIYFYFFHNYSTCYFHHLWNDLHFPFRFFQHTKYPAHWQVSSFLFFLFFECLTSLWSYGIWLKTRAWRFQLMTI